MNAKVVDRALPLRYEDAGRKLTFQIIVGRNSFLFEKTGGNERVGFAKFPHFDFSGKFMTSVTFSEHITLAGRRSKSGRQIATGHDMPIRIFIERNHLEKGDVLK